MLFILAFLLLCPGFAAAQTSGFSVRQDFLFGETVSLDDASPCASLPSLSFDSSAFSKAWHRQCPGHDVHRLKPLQLVAPTLLFATGASIAFVPEWKSSVDVPLRDCLQRDGHSQLRFDDYVQYLPVATVYGLNLCGLKGQHGYRDLTNLTAASYIIAIGLMASMKYTIDVERPNGHRFSFPSGHTITAFTGAEILRREYRDYPYIGVAGYAVATGVGFMRIYNNRHWLSDVLAGAGIAILSTSIAYWLAPYLRF